MNGRSLVIGGGLSGLTAAHALASRGADVLVLEASERAGGAARTERRGEYLLELGPNTVRPTPELRSLIRELALSEEAIYTDRRLPRFIDWKGTLHEAPLSPRALIQTRLLSPGGKLRLLCEPFVRARRSVQTDEDETVADFVTRRLGAQAAQRLIEPFVGGVFAGTASSLSVRDAFPTLVRWEHEHGSLFAALRAARRGRQSAGPDERGDGPAAAGELLSFREGLETLPRALAARLGSSFRRSCPVTSIAPRDGRWSVTAAGEDVEAERVLLAAPALQASTLVAPFAPEAARALAAIPHPPLIVLHLSWPQSAVQRPLNGFGHLVVPAPSRRILGSIWSSSLFPGRAPAQTVLLTVFVGGARDPGAAAMDDGALVALAARDLTAAGLVRGDPEPVLVTRWARSIPQYECGHSNRIAALVETERRWPGLHFIGNYRGGVAVGDVVREGLKAGSSLER